MLQFVTVTYPLDGRYEEFVADDGQRYEQVQGGNDVQHHGTILPFLFREQVPREVIDSWRRTVEPCGSNMLYVSYNGLLLPYILILV